MAIRPFTTILAAGAALIAGFAAAQGPQQGTPARVGQRAGPQAPGPVEQGSDGPIVSIEFKGGTLGDLVRSLQAQGKDPVNIALQGDAAAIPVERMALRNVTVHSALEAALGSRINTVLFEADGTSKQITLEQLAGNGDAAAVFVITRHETQARQMGREPSVQVFSIQKLVSGSGAMPPEVVLTAIDTGLGLQTRAEGARPQIKFHKDSGLLLVRGEGMDVNLIEQIVSRLQKDHERQVAEESRRKAVEIDRATRRKKAESIIRENDAYIASSAEQIKLLDAAIKENKDSRQEQMQRNQISMSLSNWTEARSRAQADLDRIKAETDAGLGADGSPTDATGPDSASQSGGDVREERIRALEARIAALEAELVAGRGQGVRQRSR